MIGNQRKGRCAVVQVVADLQVIHLGNNAVGRRINRGVREVQLRFVQMRLGFTNARMTVGFDVRVAVQSHNGAGDLLLDGRNALP
ncbi:hypothetical protein D3C75_1268110 [compost metagenome]